MATMNDHMTLDGGLTVKFVRLFDILRNDSNSFYIMRGRWYSSGMGLVAVEYNSRVRWLGKVLPLP